MAEIMTETTLLTLIRHYKGIVAVYEKMLEEIRKTKDAATK